MNFIKNLFRKNKKQFIREEKQKTISYREMQAIKQKRKQRLTRYFFGENYLWALNEKNATEKALKKGWITEIKK